MTYIGKVGEFKYDDMRGKRWYLVEKWETEDGRAEYRLRHSQWGVYWQRIDGAVYSTLNEAVQGARNHYTRYHGR